MKLSFDQDLPNWIEHVHQSNPMIDISFLTKTCQFAQSLVDEKPILYFDSALAQGLNIAQELLVLNCDTNTLAAALFYPTFYHYQPATELVSEQLNENVVKLVTGVRRMEAIHHLNTKKSALDQQHQIDNLRKMSLAIVDDIRIVLIKLAERLVILKNLRLYPPQQQQELAQQIMNIYAPLANRLGIGQFKWQMEDLSFRYLNPDKYIEISKALNMRRSDREIHIKEFIEILTQLFSDAQITKFQISGRAKHIFSIYRKIQQKQVDFNQIFDTSAVRILVPTINDCYTSLSIVHGEWAHVGQEFDDYIAKPKPNGYRSIHTVIIGPKNINIEIQIRTYQMHEEAELGIAAHWKYKEDNKAKSSYEQKISWLRNVIDWQKEVSDPEDQNIYKKIFEDRVYVFTPNGEIHDLDAGATPLDFAYQVHTELGHRCRGAKVNNILVPLTHPLKTGDQVTILTTKIGQPSRDWLNPQLGYLKTSRARNKVRNWFKKQNKQELLEAGENIWEKIVRRSQAPKPDLDQVATRFNFKNGQDLLIALGAGDIGATTVLHRINQPTSAIKETSETKENVMIPLKKKGISKKSGQSNLIIEGIGNLLTQLAKCCKPIPGDHIIGYITKGRGVTIHQQACHNVQNILQLHPERIIKEVKWSHIGEQQNYPVELSIQAEDRPGLIRDISNILANINISLLGLNSRVDKLKNSAYISLTIEVNNLTPLQKVITLIRQTPGVSEVTRV